MLNHFVSELGEIGVSHLWIIFSIGLIIGGAFYLLFMIGLGFYIENIIAKIGMLLGSFSAIACILVGFFPMNFLVPHYLAALSFFMGAMLTILVFTLAIAIQKEPKIPKLFIILGLVVFGIYMALNTIDFSTIGENLDMGTGGIINRPAVWNLAIIEWAAVLAVSLYLLLIAVYVYLNERNKT